MHRQETATRMRTIVSRAVWSVFLSGLCVTAADAQDWGTGASDYSGYDQVTPTDPSVDGSGMSHDRQSGNTYRWHRDYFGNTTVRGSNLRTGSTWSTTIEPDGSMSGTDADFNSWTYDRDSGNYFNYGTGRTCFGRGQWRQCY